jgi:Ran GTPase-activating protein (RanGAP) involved in mRNA processing and transport
LSHNKIGDQGVRRISKFLIKNQILTNLNLSNNSIGYDGSRYLAQALKINKTLEILNLKLNSLDDKAGA